MNRTITTFLPLGVLFGFLLSRAGATTQDHYAGLFLLRDPQLLLVIAVAGVVGAIGVFVARRVSLRALTTGSVVAFQPKPMRPGLVPGALLFGAGWGLTGACPGTALAMLGEGKFAVVATLVGIVAGTWAFGWRQSRAATPAPAVDVRPTTIVARRLLDNSTVQKKTSSSVENTNTPLATSTCAAPAASN